MTRIGNSLNLFHFLVRLVAIAMNKLHSREFIFGQFKKLCSGRNEIAVNIQLGILFSELFLCVATSPHIQIYDANHPNSFIEVQMTNRELVARRTFFLFEDKENPKRIGKIFFMTHLKHAKTFDAMQPTSKQRKVLCNFIKLEKAETNLNQTILLNVEKLR